MIEGPLARRVGTGSDSGGAEPGREKLPGCFGAGQVEVVGRTATFGPWADVVSPRSPHPYLDQQATGTASEIDSSTASNSV